MGKPFLIPGKEQGKSPEAGSPGMVREQRAKPTEDQRVCGGLWRSLEGKLGLRPRREPLGEGCGEWVAWIRGEMNIPGAPRSPLIWNSSARGEERVVGWAVWARLQRAQLRAGRLRPWGRGEMGDLAHRSQNSGIFQE